MTLHSLIIAGGVAAVLTVASFHGVAFLDRLELTAESVRFRMRGPRPAGNDIVIVGIDSKSISERGRWPWSRKTMAELISRLAELEPSVIAVDFSFPEDVSDPGADLALAKAIKDAGNVILGYYFYISPAEAAHQSRRDFLANLKRVSRSRATGVIYSRAKPLHLPLPTGYGLDASAADLSRAAAGCGFFNVFPERDGSIRKTPLVIRSDNANYLSFAVAAICEKRGRPPVLITAGEFGVESVRVGTTVIPVDEQGQLLINYYGPSAFPEYSASDVMAGNVPRRAVEGRIVVLGGTSLGYFERRVTPFTSSSPSAEIQANAIATILNGDFLVASSATAIFSMLLIVALSLATGTALPRFQRIQFHILFAGGLLLLYLAANFYFFSLMNICLNIVYPSLAVILSYAFVGSYINVHYQIRSARLREAVSGLASTISAIFELDQLLDRIVDAVIRLMGARRSLLVLDPAFCSGANEKRDGTEASIAGLRIVRIRGNVPLSGAEFDFIASALADARKRKKGRIVPRAPSLPRFRRARSEGALIGSLLAVPLSSRGKLIGLLYADNRPGDERFHPLNLPILASFAVQAAVAIENAMLYSRLKDAEATLRDENIYLRKEIAREQRLPSIIGESAKMREIYHLIERAALSDIVVLLLGETGTGKGLIARAIHDLSPRKDKPFVVQNCGALPDSLLESELFGHKRGSFTGAVNDKKGLFEVADGGTVFLDEIGDTSLAMQSRLLHVIQDGLIRPIGSTREIRVDVRIISATNKNLAEEIEAGRFREDLFHRLNVLSITIPPLRERKDDIPLLVQEFIAKYCKKTRKHIRGISREAMAQLMAYGWPGNVRELENEIEKAVALSNDGDLITTETLSGKFAAIATEELVVSRATGHSTLHEILASIEKKIIAEALARHGGNKSRTAEELGISRTGLKKKMQRYGLSHE